MLTQQEIKEVLNQFLIYEEESLIAYYESYFNAFRSNNDTKDRFAQLESVIKLVDYSTFQPKIIDYLKHIDIYSFFGREGLIYFSSIMAHSTSNKESALNQIRFFIDNCKERLRRIRSILCTLDFLDPKPSLPEPKLKENQSILTIKFQNQCNITNLSDLKTISDDWSKLIKHSYSISGENPPDKIEFSNIKKGSFIIDFPLSLELISSFGSVIMFILSAQNIKLKNRKLALEIQQMEGVFKEETKLNILKDIDDTIKKENKKLEEKILKKMMLNPKFKIANPEMESKTKKIYLEKLIDFIDKGGEITFTTNNDSTEVKEIKELYNEIKETIDYQKNPKYLEDLSNRKKASS